MELLKQSHGTVQAVSTNIGDNQPHADRLRHFLVADAWPLVPRGLSEHSIPKVEREAILGYGPDGLPTARSDFTMTDLPLAT